MRRLLLAIAILAVALPQPASAAVPVAVFDGRGHGHGVGMAQDGALAMGRGGASTADILGQFYPGTGLGKIAGVVRVPVHDAGPATTEARLVVPNGGVVRDARPGQHPSEVDHRLSPGTEFRIRWDGRRYQLLTATAPVTARGQLPPLIPAPETDQAGPIPTSPPPSSSTTTTTSTPPSTTPPVGPTTTTSPAPTTTTTPAADPPPNSSTRSLWVVPDGGGSVVTSDREGRRYRGAVEATAASGSLRLVNEVDLETYLKGMGEVLDPTWPPASLRAQAIAARTYAMRAMAVGGEICDTQRCQVYLGSSVEYRAMSKAVDDTRGQVIVFNRALASAVYSANAGGISATREEGFGQSDSDYPYLRAAPYPTADPKPWTAQIALADVANRLRYPGRIDAIGITSTGPSGRVQEVTLNGAAGVVTKTGLEVADALRLKSTLFAVRVGQADEAPPPPEEVAAIQAPPEVSPLDNPALAHEFVSPPLSSVAAPTSAPAGVGGLAMWALVVLGLVTAALVSVAHRNRQDTS